jgi:hypothetical protein
VQIFYLLPATRHVTTTQSTRYFPTTTWPDCTKSAELDGQGQSAPTPSTFQIRLLPFPEPKAYSNPQAQHAPPARQKDRYALTEASHVAFQPSKRLNDPSPLRPERQPLAVLNLRRPFGSFAISQPLETASATQDECNRNRDKTQWHVPHTWHIKPFEGCRRGHTNGRHPRPPQRPYGCSLGGLS